MQPNDITNSSQLVILDNPDEIISSFFLKCKVKTTQSWGTAQTPLRHGGFTSVPDFHLESNLRHDQLGFESQKVVQPKLCPPPHKSLFSLEQWSLVYPLWSLQLRHQTIQVSFTAFFLDAWPLTMGPICCPKKVSKEVWLLAAQLLRKTQFLSTSRRRPEITQEYKSLKSQQYLLSHSIYPVDDFDSFENYEAFYGLL